MSAKTSKVMHNYQNQLPLLRSTCTESSSQLVFLASSAVKSFSTQITRNKLSVAYAAYRVNQCYEAFKTDSKKAHFNILDAKYARIYSYCCTNLVPPSKPSERAVKQTRATCRNSDHQIYPSDIIPHCHSTGSVTPAASLGRGQAVPYLLLISHYPPKLIASPS